MKEEIQLAVNAPEEILKRFGIEAGGGTSAAGATVGDGGTAGGGTTVEPPGFDGFSATPVQ
jgi:hypothetical protein